MIKKMYLLLFLCVGTNIFTYLYTEKSNQQELHKVLDSTILVMKRDLILSKASLDDKKQRDKEMVLTLLNNISFYNNHFSDSLPETIKSKFIVNTFESLSELYKPKYRETVNHLNIKLPDENLNNNEKMKKLKSVFESI